MNKYAWEVQEQWAWWKDYSISEYKVHCRLESFETLRAYFSPTGRVCLDTLGEQCLELDNLNDLVEILDSLKAKWSELYNAPYPKWFGELPHTPSIIPPSVPEESKDD